MKKLNSVLLFLLLVTSAASNGEELLQAIANADAASGEAQAIACKACHAHEKGASAKLGPNLFEVVGRKVGSAEGFKYSEAVKAHKGEWSLAKLDQFLENPQSMIPGIAMAYPGVSDASARYAVLAWLRLQSENPVDLPKATSQQAIAQDPDMNLLPDGLGKNEVFYTCSVCHSIKLVVQQGMTRYSWEETLDWMVEEQEMSPMENDQKELVLDYLSKHYGINR